MAEYIFEGEVVKLNAKDYYKWRDMYPALDLTAELTQIDEEFSIRLREGEKLKKWFSECYARLNGRNKIAAKNAPRPNFQQQRLCDATGAVKPASTTRERSIELDLSDRSWAN